MSLPLLALCGLGYEVTRPGGNRAWLAIDNVVVEEDLAAGAYLVNHPDLPEPLTIPAEEMERACLQAPNLVVARVHEARRARARADAAPLLYEGDQA